MTAQIRQLRPAHSVVVVPVPEDVELFGAVTHQPRCTEPNCYLGPFVSSESRAREIGWEHTCKANGTWEPAW